MDDQVSEFEFAGRLKKLIGNDSVRAFGRKTGISEKQLRKYLSGGSKPGLDNLISISKVTGVSIEWLATGERTEQKDEITDYQPSMEAQKILELIDTLEPGYRREILLRIEAIHEANQNAKELRELKAEVAKLQEKLG